MTNLFKTLAVSVALAICFPGSSIPAEAVAVDPWHGTTVGMSVAEVRKLFPTAQPIREKGSRPGWVALLRATKTPIDGLRQTIEFTFKDSRLINVGSSIGGQPDPTAITGPEVQQILSGLQGKYGRPLRCKGPDNDLLLACFWHKGGMFVGYMGRTNPLPMALTFTSPWETRDEALLQ